MQKSKKFFEDYGKMSIFLLPCPLFSISNISKMFQDKKFRLLLSLFLSTSKKGTNEPVEEILDVKECSNLISQKHNRSRTASGPN